MACLAWPDRAGTAHGVDLSPTRPPAAQLQLEHMLSMHVRSRMFHDLDDAASFIKAISQLYEVYDEIRKRRQAAAALQAAAGTAAAVQGAAAAVKGGGAEAQGAAASGGEQPQELLVTEPANLGEEKTQRIAEEAARYSVRDVTGDNQGAAMQQAQQQQAQASRMELPQRDALDQA